ncbi:T6K12.7 protein [Striga asiatica]|uniref:T6K12.7 protein n=1 Tax=Striga asiatica TaxID=4170 RepID=A0A5A7QC09_STRAF|nr:T6K12.7 protein [Striga asiatica]
MTESPEFESDLYERRQGTNRKRVVEVGEVLGNKLRGGDDRVLRKDNRICIKKHDFSCNSGVEEAVAGGGSGVYASLTKLFVIDDNTYTKSHLHRRFAGGRTGESRRNWGKDIDPNRRSRFSDAYPTDDYYEEDEREFRTSTKQRKWWSDDFDVDDDEEDERFGVLEASIGFDWVLKVTGFSFSISTSILNLITTVIASLVLGTGPNSIIMAIALPLAQSALSIAADTLWGTFYDSPRTKNKKKKKNKPFARMKVKREKEVRFQSENGMENYKSWGNGNRSQFDFGGWDELDKEPRVRPVKREPEVQERVIISRRTKGDTPLFMRILIAMFPYLGFWTSLF